MINNFILYGVAANKINHIGLLSNHLTCFVIVDCTSIYDSGVRTDGVYRISPQCVDPFDVFCDMTGGGWTVVQKRFHGNVSFARNYNEYTDGFGSVDSDHWLGLERIHLLTSRLNTPSSLRISVQFDGGTRGYQQYIGAWVGDRAGGYILHVDREVTCTLKFPNGWEACNSLFRSDSIEAGSPFSTDDHDVDGWAGGSCASEVGGGGGW
jgi:hypothetical protein